MVQKFVYQKQQGKLFQSQITPNMSKFIRKVDCYLLSNSFFVVQGPKDTPAEDVFEVTFTEYEAYLPHMYQRWRE
jgi:hypothetical protein